MTVLSVRDLSVTLGEARVLSGVSLDLTRGERLGIIGESGSGKTMTALAIMALLPSPLRASGQVLLDGRNLYAMNERQLSRIRGRQIAMVFQEPMTALNPAMRIGRQIAEAVRVHRDVSRGAARERARELLRRVDFSDPATQARAYPHQLSGGQRQRVMLAMAIACDPAVILADEPTTALDVTVQAQMLALMSRLVTEEGSALILISHDLAVVAGMCERLAVMYGGRIVETGGTWQVLDRARHPYTAGLLDTSSAISLDSDRSRAELPSIPGQVPAMGAFGEGCPFRARCARATSECEAMPPLRLLGDHHAACWHPILAPGEARVPAQAAENQRE